MLLKLCQVVNGTTYTLYTSVRLLTLYIHQELCPTYVGILKARTRLTALLGCFMS